MMRTHFAPAKRASRAEIAQSVRELAKNPLLDNLLRLADGLLVVVNRHRQIVAVNDVLLATLGIDDPDSALGLRPGEALSCVHAHEMEGGCGTSRHCATCGAAIAMVTSLAENRTACENCVLTAQRDGATVERYFRVSACPITCLGQRYVLLFLHDQTDEQQWAALERSFYHDINNVVMGLLGISQILAHDSGKADEADRQQVYELSLRLAKEVAIQSSLMRDGLHAYQAQFQEVSIADILRDTEHVFANHRAASGRALTFSPAEAPDWTVETDAILLERVLNNMIVNALEATDLGGEARVYVEKDPEGQAVFRVWNRRPIPPEVTVRIFQRNFSTKAEKGRGLGTYSMKLFGETYLKGQVDFSTSEADGTEFRLTLPLDPRSASAE